MHSITQGLGKSNKGLSLFTIKWKVNDMFKTTLKLMISGAVYLFCASAYAVPVTYIAADDNVSSLAQMVNSQAAFAAFNAVTGPLNVEDFEGAPLPNLTVTGGSVVTGSSCGPLCGFNTTAAGANHVELFGGQVTFSFTNPVDAFGFYVNGLQTDLVAQQTIFYVDGSSNTQTINFPSAVGGGGAFVGFVDFGQQIASVTFDATNDILGFDDLRFGNSATNPNPVSEPGSLALLGLGVFMLNMARRKRSV